MFRKTAMWLVVVASAGAAAAVKRVECRTTADNWVDAPPWGPHSRKFARQGVGLDACFMEPTAGLTCVGAARVARLAMTPFRSGERL